MKTPPEICPHCGAEVPPRAIACPGCGADEHTGWSERAATEHLGLPDEEFDYDEFVREEFGGQKNLRRPGLGWIWWLMAVLALAGILALLLRR